MKVACPKCGKVQEVKKCLILKGRLNWEDLQVIKKNLDYRGLCIQSVVLNQKEIDTVFSAFY